ncbi:hypothetical protein X564_01245 [Pseudoalteromonas agarivorans]|nr:hypothetical protein X564_01245 [Pseudoalteromonas agarivorans]
MQKKHLRVLFLCAQFSIDVAKCSRLLALYKSFFE